MVVGVLALQGGVSEHVAILEGLGVRTRLVRTAADFQGLGALVLPGGESTTMNKLLDVFSMRDPLTDAIHRIPTLGTCAGLILLAQLGGLDVTVQRNAFGPQVDSTEAELQWRGLPVTAAFIRAPEITHVGEGVEVTTRYQQRIVGVRQGFTLGVSFHPELCGEETIHQELLELI